MGGPNPNPNPNPNPSPNPNPNQVRLEGGHTWTLFEVPHEKDTWVARLRGFTTMWGYLL